MNYIKLMRPKHYIKNLLIVLPLLFNGDFFDVKKLLLLFMGFISFSFVASSIYILNDIRDIEKDRLHPIKKNRPLASGNVSKKSAYIIFCILLILVCSIVLYCKLNIISIFLLLFYFCINILYSFGLKNIPLLDVVILVSGFFVRVLFGASILNISVSNWLYLTVISISFFFALGKRRNEIIKNGSKGRNVLKKYNKDFLDKNMYMFLSMSIIFYSLWVSDKYSSFKNGNLLIWTVPVVIVIIMRYSMIIESDCDGDPVEVITKDKILILLSMLLSLSLFLILYY